MPIDLSALFEIGKGVVLLFVGALVGRLFERRPRLTYFLSHAGAFRVQQPGGAQLALHTHVVILRNTGRLSAKNVHVPHRGMLAAANINISIEPPLDHKVVPLSNGTEEILFPLMPPQ